MKGGQSERGGNDADEEATAAVAEEEEEAGVGGERERERGEISTSSITNSYPSIGCRYIQTLLRKGQSLCRPLCRPRAFLLLSLSTAVAPLTPPPLAPLTPPAPPCSRLLLLHLLSSSASFLFRGKGRTAFLRRWKMRPRRRWKEENAERRGRRMSRADG